MANNRKINGKTTEQRLQEELQRIKQTREAVTVAEFARRARVSYASLTHDYREIADEVRRLRDDRRPTSRRSPVTLPRHRREDLVEATTLIQQLRQQISDLTRGIANTRAERDKWEKRASSLEHVQDQNERLRGIVVALTDGLSCEQDQQMIRRLIEGFGPSEAL